MSRLRIEDRGVAIEDRGVAIEGPQFAMKKAGYMKCVLGGSPCSFV